MDPASLEGRHWLELEHLSRRHDPFRGPVGQVAQLAFAPAAIVFDIDQDSRPLADLSGQEQVHEMLQRRQALALAADEDAQGFLLVTLADNVEAISLRSEERRVGKEC